MNPIPILRRLAPGICPAVCAFALAACAIPPVRVETTEPIAVDINMRVDVYQHGGAAAKPGATPETLPSSSTPESRRRNRMADIQTFKDARLIGEGRDGLLAVIEEPPGEYGQYVRKTVSQENADRTEVMRSIAEKTRRPLEEIQRNQAEEWRIRSFRGEWVETPQGEGFRWMQKTGEESQSS